ncbi:hypothetical protein PAMA_004008 [Pampus argenteus]
MERRPAVVWTCLLGAALTLVLPPALSITTSQTVPRPPRLISCVFLNRANVTCRWDAGDIPVTHYTLQVQMMPGDVATSDFEQREARRRETSVFEYLTPRIRSGFDTDTKARRAPGARGATCVKEGQGRTPLTRFLANGKVLFYNVTCQTESAQVLNDYGSCKDLNNSCTSCSLLLPGARSSCALTASTSAGTSAEARIWLLGVSEAEPPPPSQITASPLDDNNLDVRWTAPVDQSVSGFVVEWFAVREKNSSIQHWKRLNSSRTALVITEGVKPMERYSISVKALYGKQGAGQKRTLHIYTRQGVPSAGPTLEVQHISGNTVELRWTPVPVELCHGFIRSYTLYYTAANRPIRRKFVSGHVHRYSLEDLSPGNYDIYMQANTDAGAGAAGLLANVHIGGEESHTHTHTHTNRLTALQIDSWLLSLNELCVLCVFEGSEEISMVICAFPLLLTCLVLVLMACLAQNKRMKQKLFQYVPDPSNSSLAHWTPKTTSEPAVPESSDIKYSEVILLSESDLHDPVPDQDFSYQGVCKIQTYSSYQYSPLPVSGAQTPQITQKINKEYTRISTRDKTTSTADCPTIYSNVLVSQIHQTLPATILCPSHPQTNVSVNDSKLQPGGDSEHGVGSDSPTSETDELNSFFLRQYHSSVSFPDSLSHPVEGTSPQHCFSRSHFNSVPSHLPVALAHPDSCSDTSATTSSPVRYSVFVDFSYCPVECGPYVSYNT